MIFWLKYEIMFCGYLCMLGEAGAEVVWSVITINLSNCQHQFSQGTKEGKGEEGTFPMLRLWHAAKFKITYIDPHTSNIIKRTFVHFCTAYFTIKYCTYFLF